MALFVYVWMLELIVTTLLLIGGWIRKRGLWFLFGIVFGIYSLLDLSANALTLSFMTDAGGMVDVTLSAFMYLIPLFLIIFHFSSIVSLRRQLGRGAI